MASGGNPPDIITDCREFAFGEEVAKQCCSNSKMVCVTLRCPREVPKETVMGALELKSRQRKGNWRRQRSPKKPHRGARGSGADSSSPSDA